MISGLLIDPFSLLILDQKVGRVSQVIEKAGWILGLAAF